MRQIYDQTKETICMRILNGEGAELSAVEIAEALLE